MIRSTSSQSDSFYFAHSAPDLTPVLDVIFMLLVFFMLTANPVEHVFTIDLPKLENDQIESINQQKNITLTIFPEAEHWEINGKTLYDWKAVKQMILELQAQNKETDYLIAADRQVSIESLLQVLNFFRTQGISVANILMQAQPETHKPVRYL